MKKKTIMIIVIAILILIVAGIITSFKDSARVRAGMEPKYTIKIVSDDDRKVTYWGLGYKVVRYVGVSPNEPYKNAIGIKYGSWFMDYKLENNNIEDDESIIVIPNNLNKHDSIDVGRIERFIENTNKGIDDEITIKQYTIEGDQITTVIRYSGTAESFEMTMDTTQDKFGKQEITTRVFDNTYKALLEKDEYSTDAEIPDYNFILKNEENTEHICMIHKNLSVDNLISGKETNMDIKLIAQNAIKITSKEGMIIYCDPFKIEEAKNDADIIFVTHSHYDHFSPEDIEMIKNDNTKIVVTKDLHDKAIKCGFEESQVLVVTPNNEYEFGGISFSTIPAYNTNKDFHKREYDWVSYLLNIDGEIVYVAGDTDITDEALKVNCDIALVPVGGTYTMTAKEAANLIEQIKPSKYAIPTHYQTIVGSIEDAKLFKELLEGKVEVRILL